MQCGPTSDFFRFFYRQKSDPLFLIFRPFYRYYISSPFFFSFSLTYVSRYISPHFRILKRVKIAHFRLKLVFWTNMGRFTVQNLNHFFTSFAINQLQNSSSSTRTFHSSTIFSTISEIFSTHITYPIILHLNDQFLFTSFLPPQLLSSAINYIKISSSSSPTKYSLEILSVNISNPS